jgi:hypothetical protein
MAEAEVTPDMLAHSHMPRLSIHWSWEAGDIKTDVDGVSGGHERHVCYDADDDDQYQRTTNDK